MGRIDKRVIAAIALVAGILAVVVLVLASSGDDEGGKSAAVGEQAPQDGANRANGGSDGGSGGSDGDGSQDGAAGSGSAQGSGGAQADGGREGGSGGGSGGSGGSGGGSGGSGGDGAPGSGGNGSPGSGSAPGAGGGGEDQAPARELKPVVELAIENNKVVGGFRKLSYQRNDRVRLRVRSDVNDIVQVDGYQISRTVDNGQVAEFDFDAVLNGVFEVSLRKRGLALAFVVVKGDIEKRR